MTGSRYRSQIVAITVVLLVCFLSNSAMALIEASIGNNPVRDDNWPAGSVDVANLKTRVGWWEGPPFGGGQSNFLYRGDAAAFQKTLDAFAKIKWPKRQLVIHDGGRTDSPFLKGDKSGDQYDWSFTVWNPQNWNSLYNDPASVFSAEDPDNVLHEPVNPPRLDVFVGGADGIDFSKVKIPTGVDAIDERADVSGFVGGSAIIGDVFDMMTSKPIMGAKVSVVDEKKTVAEGTTDAGGQFELKGVGKGSIRVLASAVGYAPRLLGNVELRGNTLKRFTVMLSPIATLAGTVIDTNGKPIARLTISANEVIGPDGRGYVLPEQRETLTDDKGHFELSGLSNGHTQIYVYGEHFAGLDILKLYQISETNVTVRVTATGDIKGRVLDRNGKPVTHGNVDIEPPGEPRDRIGKWSGGSNTATDGSFHFENVPPGQYAVSAMATNPGPALFGKDPNEKIITVNAGATTEVDVTGR